MRDPLDNWRLVMMQEKWGDLAFDDPAVETPKTAGLGGGNPYHCPAGTGITSGRFTDAQGTTCNPTVQLLSAAGLQSRKTQLERALTGDITTERRERLEEEVNLVDAEGQRRDDSGQPEGDGISVEPDEVNVQPLETAPDEGEQLPLPDEQEPLASIGARRPNTAADIRRGASGADPSLTTELDVFPMEKLDEASQRLAANIPGFTYDPNLSEEENLEAVVEKIKSNVMDAWDMAEALGPEFAEKNRYWYLAAHNYAVDLAREYDVPEAVVAGMMAGLSPQASWATNITNTRRFLDVLVEDPVLDENSVLIGNAAMWSRGRLKREPLPFTDGEILKNAAGEKIKPEDIQPLQVGQRLSELTPLQTAHALYGLHAKPEGSEIAGPRYRGEASDQFDMTIDGDGEYTLVDDLTWDYAGTPSTGMLTTAVEVFRAESIDDIARTMGAEHKVRSFARNIMDPFTIDDPEVTIDSHHVGISMGIPISGKTSVPFYENDGTRAIGSSGKNKGLELEREIYKIGTSGNSETTTGLRGAYPLMGEGLRRATEEIRQRTGIEYKASEIQSITWAAWRAYWPPVARRAGADRVIDVRIREAAGEFTAAQALQEIERVRQEEIRSVQTAPELAKTVGPTGEIGVHPDAQD